MNYKSHCSKRRIIVLLLGVVCSIILLAQGVTIRVKDPRPVAAAALEVERLSGIPVNYEDLRYDNSADTQDVTDSVRTPEQKAQAPGNRIIVPLGGDLSASIAVDPTSQKLVDNLSTANALNSLLSAANASSTATGKFRLDSFKSIFHIVPTQWHSINATSVAAAPLLSTPVTLPGEQLTGYATLKAILTQVSRASGFKVDIGSVPIKPLALSQVVIAASNEPARYVLARLFSAVSTAGSALPPERAPGMSYRLLFDPKFRSYTLNIHVVPNPNTPEPVTPTAPPGAPDPLRGYKKGN